MNFCVSCGNDFTSVAGFDRHRCGAHQYDFREGLALDPPREDGRRCMEKAEMTAAGLEPDGRGRWRLAITDSERERLRRLAA